MQKIKMSYTRLGIMSAIIFMVIVVLFEFLFALNSKKTIVEIVNYMWTLNYIVLKLIMGIIYGFFMIFLFKRKENKLNKNKNF